MDLSALIVVIVLAGLFFSFIGWLAIYSRKISADKPRPKGSEIELEGE